MSYTSLNVLDLAALLESHVAPEYSKELARSLFVRFGANAETLTDTSTILDCQISGYRFDECATCGKGIPAGEEIRQTFELSDAVDISRVPGCRNERYLFAHVERTFCSSLCSDPDGSIELYRRLDV